MRRMSLLPAAGVLLASLAPSSLADGRNPGSVLVFPITRSGGFSFTVVNVTNINPAPVTPFSFGGTTLVHYEYVNVQVNFENFLLPLDCVVFDRFELLTPADTKSVLTTCHNASTRQEGYLVVSAVNPSLFQTKWSHNFLIGSELVVTNNGGIYSIDAIPFSSPVAPGGATDLDGDGQLDFNNLEYEGIPDLLYIDSFVALARTGLVLINFTGGVMFTVAVKFDVWNDNEFLMSATVQFRCWFEEGLPKLSPAFEQDFLANNTPHDPTELDVTCDNVGDLETGWAKITGLVANSQVESIPNPALLGAMTEWIGPSINGGLLLWESAAKQFNGDFLKFGADDPEFP
jgi:hypothetical protein